MSATPRHTRRTVAASAASAIALVLASAATALAEGEGAAAPPADDPHRWALWTSCSVFFGAVIAFVVVTHRRAAATTDRLAAIERRLDEAEKRR